MRYYILFFIICIIYLYFNNTHNILVYRDLKYYRFDGLKSPHKQSKDIIEPFNTIFQNNNIRMGNSYKDSNIIFFKLLTDYIFLFDTLYNIKHPLFIYGIKSIDLLSSKSTLYSVLSKNQSLVYKYTPITYILEDENNYNELLDDFDKSKLYILKKNIQRQKGCTITNNLEYLKNSKEQGYVVAQELLQNPFTVNGHKINLRQYLILIIKKDVKSFLYNDGFMYYTPKKFKKGSIDKDRHITTGYIDREIYKQNPLTVKDFYKSLGNKQSTILKNNLIKLFNFVIKSYKPHLLHYDSNHHVNFMILGCDVAVDNSLGCKLMEINKGPDLSYKDKKDKQVKFNLIKNTLHEINLINSPHNNFIHLN